MTLTTLTMERAHDAAVDRDPTLPERPTRRTFSAEYEQRILDAYEAATEEGTKGVILCREGLSTSHISEWRRASRGRAGQGPPGHRHPGRSIGALGAAAASGSTMYRLLRAGSEVRERRATASHPPRVAPELVATAPDEVWSHDATALRGPRRGVWYDLFLMLDLFSRYRTGWMIVEGHVAEVMRDWIDSVVAAHGPFEPGRLFIHADRGSAMTSKPVSQLLADPAHRPDPWATPRE